MADLSGIIGQINGLRGSYTGAFGPNSVRPQAQPSTWDLPLRTMGGGGTYGSDNGSLRWGLAGPNATSANPNPGWTGIDTIDPNTLPNQGRYVGPQPAPLNIGRMANPGQYGGAFGSVAPLPPANSMGLPANWRSLTMPTTPATTGFYDPSGYTPVPRTLNGETFGTMRPQGVAKLGLLPQGTNLSDTSIFGEMGPASGWGVRPGDVVRAWTAMGQNPGQLMYDMAVQGGTFNPKGKFAKSASLPPDQMWNAAADDMVKMAMRAYLHDQGFNKHPVRNKNEPLKPK